MADLLTVDPLKEATNSIKGFFKSQGRKDANAEFHALDKDHSNAASLDEIASFVAHNHQLWAMLSVNLGDTVSEVDCQRIAARVAMELASGLTGEDALQAEITKDQFYQFRERYMVDPKGNQEFFHRAVFATFDKDRNNMLDVEELDGLLETFYSSGALFQGSDVRLPPMDDLKTLILDTFDTDGTGSLSFDAVRKIISGEAAAMAKQMEEDEDAIAEAEAEEKMDRDVEEDEEAKDEDEAAAQQQLAMEEEWAATEAAEKARVEAQEKMEAEEKARVIQEEEWLAAAKA